MLRYVLFDTTLFSSGDNTEKTRQNVMWLLEALVQRNMEYLRQRPSTPRLYRSGVRYEVPAQFNGECEEVRVLRGVLGKLADRPEAARVLERIQDVFGGERFRDIGRIIENTCGDCDNLACWRVAELRQSGIQARPWMTHRTRPDGGTTYHALVLWPPMAGVALDDFGKPQPTSEDPSLLLGMGGSARAADRAEEIRKNQERCDILRGKSISSISNGPTGFEELEVALGLRPAARTSAKPEVEAMVAELDKLFRSAA